jgi:hypothetical protein
LARIAAVRSTAPSVKDPAAAAPIAPRAAPMSLAGDDICYRQPVGARPLQAMLAERLDEDARQGRWSSRSSAAFILCSSLGLWGAIAAAAICLRG